MLHTFSGFSSARTVTIVGSRYEATAHLTRARRLTIRVAPRWRALTHPVWAIPDLRGALLGAGLLGLQQVLLVGFQALVRWAPLPVSLGPTESAPLTPALLTLLVVAIGVVSVARGRAFHGAEHQAIAAAEAGRLTPDTPDVFAALRPADRWSPRCGTSRVVCWLFALGGLTLLAAALPPFRAPWSGWLLWPLGGALGDRLFVWQATTSHGLGRGIRRCGLAAQRLTTAAPSRTAQLVAVVAVLAVLTLEAPPTALLAPPPRDLA